MWALQPTAVVCCIATCRVPSGDAIPAMQRTACRPPASTKAASSRTCLAAPTPTPRFVAVKTQQLPLHGPLFARSIGGEGQALAVWPEGWEDGIGIGRPKRTPSSFLNPSSLVPSSSPGWPGGRVSACFSAVQGFPS
jgi:hypothetical protein